MGSGFLAKSRTEIVGVSLLREFDSGHVLLLDCMLSLVLLSFGWSYSSYQSCYLKHTLLIFY